MKAISKYFILLGLLAMHALAWPITAHHIVSGQVDQVVDGDTIHLTDQHGVKRKIRLQGIDAPETQQAWGKQSTKWLEKQIGDHVVEVVLKGRDGYGRDLGVVLLNGEDLNLKAVREGQAWWYKHYAKDQSPEDRELYARAQRDAKIRYKGLWSQKRPEAPWQWRKSHHIGKHSKAAP